jgi:hypothetical protein
LNVYTAGYRVPYIFNITYWHTTVATNQMPNHPVSSRTHKQSQDRIEIPQAKEERATKPAVKRKKKAMVERQEGTGRVTAWGHNFEQLVDYEQIYGDCKVPQGYCVNPQLGRWVMTQRAMKRKATLSDERVAQLDLIGFDWGGEERFSQAAWGQRFQQLVDYKQTHGDFKVP